MLCLLSPLSLCVNRDRNFPSIAPSFASFTHWPRDAAPQVQA